MSADRWHACPRCGTEEDLKKGYGTLREDWEFYWEGSLLKWDYGAICEKCSLKVSLSGQHETKP